MKKALFYFIWIKSVISSKIKCVWKDQRFGSRSSGSNSSMRSLTNESLGLLLTPFTIRNLILSWKNVWLHFWQTKISDLIKGCLTCSLFMWNESAQDAYDWARRYLEMNKTKQGIIQCSSLPVSLTSVLSTFEKWNDCLFHCLFISSAVSVVMERGQKVLRPHNNKKHLKPLHLEINSEKM